MSLKGKQKWFLSSPFGALVPDGLYLKWKYRLQMGRGLDLRNPKTYNEKLQWLKIHCRRPEFVMMSDKYLVKDYVAGLIGKEYVVPLLGVWENAGDIDFSLLPGSFVLKCTHDSGSVFVVHGKDTADERAIKASLGKALKSRFYRISREWVYKGIHPRIIAESCLEGEINDYKFFCFDGNPAYMFIATGRNDESRETCFDFYDMDFRHIDVKQGHPNAPVPPEKPEQWEKMKELSAKLSKGIPHVRVDFYESGGKLYFGEFTFFHWGGYFPFCPDDLDREMGELIKITE